MEGNRSRGLKLGSAAVAVALTVSLAGSLSSGLAAGSTSEGPQLPAIESAIEAGNSSSNSSGNSSGAPSPTSKIIHDEGVTEQLTSGNPTIHTRAAAQPGSIKLTRSRASAAPHLTVANVAARVTVTSWYRAKRQTRKATHVKTLKINSKWLLRLRKTTTKVRVDAPKFNAATFAVSARKLNKSYKLKPRPANAIGPNSANDYSRIWDERTTKPVWDTCNYSVSGSSVVTSVTSAKQFTYAGLRTPVAAKYRADIRAGLDKIAAVTGYTFLERPTNFTYSAANHPYNHIQFTIAENPSSPNGWGISGSAGPWWADAGGAPDQKWKLYLGGSALLTLQANAPSYARQLLAMHEVGHVMGLGHAQGSEQVMYPVIQKNSATWGSGDTTGLREVGYGGCRFGVGQVHVWYGQELDFTP